MERSTVFAELIARYQQHVAKIRIAMCRRLAWRRSLMTSSSGRTPAVELSGQTPFEHWLSGIAYGRAYELLACKSDGRNCR